MPALPPLPAQSRLWRFHAPGDFLDHRACASSLAPRAAAELLVRFPAWAGALFLLRGLLVLPFGLKHDPPPAPRRIGIFPVETETPDELILGFNDRHLDFRIAVLSAEGKIHVSTWVRPHNPGGQLYLNAVMPFHILILENAMARLARAG
jgi:hypothetical protein